MLDETRLTPALATAPSRRGLPLDYLARLFKRHLRWFLIVGTIVAVLVLSAGLLRKPIYAGVANLVVEPHQSKALERDDAAAAAPTDTNIVDTKVEMVTSRAIVDAVTRSLQLYRDPEFASVRAAGAVPGSAAYESTVTNVSRNLEARRVGLTYVFNISFNASSPEKAARIANMFVTQSISAELQSKLTVNDTINRRLNQQLQSLRNAAESADQRVQQYKIANNLVSTGSSSVAEQQVSNIAEQIAPAQADRAQKAAEYAAAQAQVRRGGAGADVNATLNSETIRALRAQEAEASRALAELSAHYGDEYPDVIKAKGQLGDIRTQIQRETSRILSGLAASVAAANQRVASLQGIESSARGVLSASSSAQAGLMELQRRADAAQAIYQSFLNRSKETAAAGGVQQADMRVVSYAEPPVAPSSPKKRLVIIAAIALGLVSGAATVFVLAYLDSGVRTGAQIEDLFGESLWGTIPDLSSVTSKRMRRDEPLPPEDFLVEHPLSAFSEAFRNLRAALTLNAATGRARVVLVTSALPGEGKSTTAFCLMRVLARSKKSVVLVDCDLRRRAASRMVKKSLPAVGLLELLRGEATLDAALVPDVAGAWVLPVTDEALDAQDPFGDSAMDDLLKTLRQRFDFVILDTPPTLAVADTRLLAAKADVTLFLLRWGSKKQPAVTAALNILRDAGVLIGGMALTRVDLRRQASFGPSDASHYFKDVKSYYFENTI